MNNFINGLSSREIAWSIWIIVVLVFFMLNKGIRKSMLSVLKVLLGWKIFLSLIIFFLHTSIYIFILYRIHFWDVSLLKDTIIWTFSFGFISLMNVNKVDSFQYFKNILIDSIKCTLAIEFLVNFFTFSLITEIILVPILVFSIMMQTVASFKKENKKVENLFKNLLTAFGIFIFCFTLYKTIELHSQLLTNNNFKSYTLPFILTITFLPFMYLYNLVVKYETLWLTLQFNIKSQRERNRVKRHILLIANFNIEKVVNISKNIAKPINAYNDLSYEMVKKISKGNYNGFDGY